MKEEEKFICSFCRATDKEAAKLIVGPRDIAICDKCVGLCVSILDQELDFTLRVHTSK